MRLAIMQPYLFPYLGYFQLVNAVDKFIFFDDVNYINKGWINRNQILKQDEAFRFTLPLVKASQNRLINEIEISNFSNWRKEFLNQVEFNYKKAPLFNFVFSWLNRFLFSKEYNLIGDIASDSVKSVADLLGLNVKFELSSSLEYKDGNLQNGQQKILKICEMLNADHYINPKNGTELYDKENFAKRNIKLNFIWMDEIEYSQFLPDKFVPYLSIIDVLMFNEIEKINELLNKYTLN